MTSIADTINCAINANQLNTFPSTTLDHLLLQSPAEECTATPIIFSATRSGADLSYPLPFRYDTSGTVSYGDDVHLMTGSLVIPANATIATDTVNARWDGIMEAPEDVVITPLMSDWYTLSSMMPISPQVFDCMSTEVHEAEGASIVAWPNPFADGVTVAVVPRTAQVDVLNSLGVLIHRGPLNAMEWRGRTSGMYVLRINGRALPVIKE
jgi:hypothetical protein